jgi:cysteine-rich repeat protein
MIGAQTLNRDHQAQRHRLRELARWTWARSRAATLATVAVLYASSANATLAGRWRIEQPGEPTEIVVVTQSGKIVSFTYGGLSFGGEVIGGTVRAFNNSVSPCAPMIGAAVRDQDRRLFGGLFDVSLVCGNPIKGTIVGQRCECFDGNGDDGDGCDARCQIEPCFTCSGDPSVCVPVADGGACDDRLDCTTGETCQDGACGPGTAVDACVDLSGPWRWHFSYGEGWGDVESSLTLEQRDEYLVLRGPSGGISQSGPIDTMTGDFHLSGNPSHVKDYFSYEEFCVGEIVGQTAADGVTLSGSATALTWAINCGGAFGVFAASRCINGTVDADDECDDDNAVAGDGCDLNCRVESCFSCAGSPSACTPLADGAACDDADDDTARSECRGGACVAAPCAGDCDNDGRVVINELVTGINIALDRVSVDTCPNVDADASGTANVSELTTAVLALLHGCAADRCDPSRVRERFEACRQAQGEAACLAAGGSWRRGGLSPDPLCICPTGQVDCPCTRPADCIGSCIAPLSGDCGSVSEGTCTVEEPSFGCFCTFLDDGHTVGICQD